MIDRVDGRGLPSEEAGMADRPAGWDGFVLRCRTAPRVLRARRDARRASRLEARALAALGDALAGDTGPTDGGAAIARVEVAAIDSRSAGLREAMASSLRDDRSDYADVSAWVRPLVIGRGLFSRAVLRHRLRRLRISREEACRRLGAATLLAPGSVPAHATSIRDSALDARSTIARACRDEALALAPFGGFLLPGPARLVVREGRAFLAAVVREARAQLVPRLPALLGLAAGWWLTSTYTDSRFLATIHSLGIGRGPRRAVDPDTYRVLKFAVPLVAAALCSYLSARLAALVRARYAAVEVTVEPPAGPVR